MSPYRRSARTLGVAADGMACADLGDAPPAVRAVEGLSETDRAAWARACQQLLASSIVGDTPPRPVRVQALVATDLARHWLVTPPPGLTSLAELRALAHARFTELYGEPARRWAIAADWQDKRPFICAAIPDWLPSTLRGALLNSGAASMEFTTALGDALSRHAALLPNEGWCCIRTPLTLVVISLRTGTAATLRQVLRGPCDELEVACRDAEEELEREALRHDRKPPTQVHWLDLAGMADATGTTARGHRVRFDVLSPRPKQTLDKQNLGRTESVAAALLPWYKALRS